VATAVLVHALAAVGSSSSNERAQELTLMACCHVWVQDWSVDMQQEQQEMLKPWCSW
jgi:hypothetical protein